MVSERLISRFEESLTELAEIGGNKEKTGIVPNLEVIDAAPGITGFIIVEDSKDGDYITAATIPGMIYANGDLVNILFIDGTEPIAYQHGSGSSGVAFAVDRVYRPDFTATVLTGDNSNDVTLTAGDLIIPDDIVHSGDIDTLISATTDKWTIEAGGLEMAAFIEAATNEVVINDGQVDINFRVEGDGEENLFFVDAGNDRVGIGTNSPENKVSIVHGSADGILLSNVTTDMTTKDTRCLLRHYDNSEEAIAFFGGASSVGSTEGRFGGGFGVQNSATVLRFYTAANTTTLSGTERMRIGSGGNVQIGSFSATAQLVVDQASTTAAEPVVYLNQADVSEPMFEFNTTIGVGNAIEAVGAKTLTTTHFIKVTLPGALTRYIPCGTIA